MSPFQILLELRMMEVQMSSSQNVTINKSISSFLQARRTSCCPTNNARELKEMDKILVSSADRITYYSNDHVFRFKIK